MASRAGPILRAIGNVQLLSSVLVLPSLALSLGDADGAELAFLQSFLVLFAVGLLMYLPTRRARSELRLRDGFLVTSAVWAIVSLVLALPLMLAPPYLGYIGALFEVVSGLTTTGSTVIVGLDGLPRSVLLYRALLQFYGGLGIVVLAVAVLPSLRVGGMQLTKGEITGPVKNTKLTPRIRETAAALWTIYLGLNVACILAYWACGMGFFDALCHGFTTVATSGFSNHDASLGHFDNPVIEIVAIVFMLLGSASFALHYVAWRRGSATVYAGDGEFRLLLRIAGVLTLVVALDLGLRGVYASGGETLRHAAFQVVSGLTTTGYTTSGFAHWPGMAPALIVLAAFVGGCAGSTAGGIKLVRVQIVARLARRELMRLVHPHGRFPVKLNRSIVGDELINTVAAFVAVFFASLIASGLAIAATGVDLYTAFAAAASCITNLGPGLGGVAAHFQDLNDAALLISALTMLIGRLEVFTVLVLLTPALWRE
ncbi:MAG: potassium transporter [Xanthomonadales bacterium]|nr:Trk system potassium uptake protein TrkH [Xanthomonadales bacterium]MCC6591702.1 potassium transporter [Xanthomonadales bacterium]MCE7931265.1 potassium transporter [Xanthomonadales bacterium PRO6]